MKLWYNNAKKGGGLMKEKITIGCIMQIFLLVLVVAFIIITFTGCTIAPNAPSDGIWYCEELQLVIEFEGREASVYSYDKNLSHMDLQLRNWNDGGFEIICDDAEGEIIEIYTGWRKHTSSDKFIISMYSKANPADNFKTQIELDDEKYTFIKIESYDEIIK